LIKRDFYCAFGYKIIVSAPKFVKHFCAACHNIAAAAAVPPVTSHQWLPLLMGGRTEPGKPKKQRTFGSLAT
jgi:hypothetical protein